MTTKTEVKHTPIPWTTMRSKTLIHIETANLGDGTPCGMPVCSIPLSRPYDADFIVQAVNSHEELLTACRLALRAINLAYNSNDSSVKLERELLESAIARAGGK